MRETVKKEYTLTKEETKEVFRAYLLDVYGIYTSDVLKVEVGELTGGIFITDIISVQKEVTL